MAVLPDIGFWITHKHILFNVVPSRTTQSLLRPPYYASLISAGQLTDFIHHLALSTLSPILMVSVSLDEQFPYPI